MYMSERAVAPSLFQGGYHGFFCPWGLTLSVLLPTHNPNMKNTMDNNNPPLWEEREMLAMHIPALLENADTICSTPELAEAPVPHMCVHIYGGAPRLTLGDMLRVWGAKGDTPWRYTDAEGHTCYRLLHVFGLSGCWRAEAFDAVTQCTVNAPRTVGMRDLAQALHVGNRDLLCRHPMSFPKVIGLFVRHPRLIINLPHVSAALPKHCGLSCPRDVQDRLARMSADLFLDELAPAGLDGCRRVAAPVSRLVVDTECLEDDSREPLAAVGCGVVPTHAFDGTEIRQMPSPRRRHALLNRYYRPHHETLARLTRASLAIHDRARILDLQSYPESYAMPGMAGAEQPDVCIGFAPYHCPTALVRAVADCAYRHELSFALNTPFGESAVPQAYQRQDARVVSLKLVLKRSLFMDESTLQPHAGMQRMRRFVEEVAAITRTFPPADAVPSPLRGGGRGA